MRITLETAPDSVTPRLLVRGDQLTARLQGRGPGSARVALVATTGLLLSGDQVDIEIRVGAGLRLELVEVAGTVAYSARGGAAAAWRVHAVLEAEATLIWDGLPFVLAEGARVRRETTVVLERGAAALIRDQLVMGRSGERGGDLTVSTTVQLEARPLFVEELDLRGCVRDDPVMLAGNRCVDTVLVLGHRWNPSFEHSDRPDRLEIYQLDDLGTVLRRCGAHSHEVQLAREFLEIQSALPPVRR